MRISEREEISLPAGATLVQVAIRGNGEVWGIINDSRLHAPGGTAGGAAASTAPVTKSGHIVRYNEIRHEWDRMDTPEDGLTTEHEFISLAASFGTEVWAITNSHRIYKYTDRWAMVGGLSPKLITVGMDGNVWAIPHDSTDIRHYISSESWAPYSGRALSLAVGSDIVFHIGMDNYAYKTLGRDLPGIDSIKLRQLVISKHDEIWGIDMSTNVCEYQEVGGWRSKGVKLNSMAIDKDGEIWGILNERVYRWPSLKKQYADAAIIKINEFIGSVGDRVGPEASTRPGPQSKPSYLQLFESRGIDIFGATSALICLSILLFYILTEKEPRECSIHTKEYGYLKWAAMLTATVTATMGAYCLGERVTASCRKIYPTAERLSDSLADSLKKFGIAAVRATIERGAATVHVPVDVHGNPIGVQGAGLQRVSAST